MYTSTCVLPGDTHARARTYLLGTLRSTAAGALQLIVIRAKMHQRIYCTYGRTKANFILIYILAM